MPWCPNCKNEYVEGITKCADCGSQLVEELPPEEEGGEDIPFPTDEERFLQEIPAQELTAEEQQALAEAKKAAARGVYKDNAQRAAEFKDSGYTLLGVGIAGLAVIILMITGVIPFQLGGSMAYLSYGVMGALFLIFIVVGIHSMRSAQNYRKEAASESNLKEEIISWCRETLTMEGIDANLPEDVSAEEEKYFKRTAVMKRMISEKFMNLDEGFLDNLVDEFYPEVFGE